MNKIFLIVGESGSGKDTIVNALCEKYGYTRIRSYTTRPSRGSRADNSSHIFVTEEEFDKLTDLVAYTKFDRYRYCATSEQVDNADFYIVDIPGAKYLMEKYQGEKQIVIIRITSSDVDRFLWLKERYGGDGAATEMALHRIKHDRLAFSDTDFHPDYTVYNSTYKPLANIVDEVKAIVDKENQIEY